MREIREYIFDTLVADPTVQTLTGYTASDNRIYLDWPPDEVVLNSTYPSYISYGFPGVIPIDLTVYVEAAQRDDLLLDINEWALTPDTRDSLGYRIETLFKDHSFYTSSYRVVFMSLMEKSDIQERHVATGQILMWRRTLQYRIGPIFEL
jgi:hypothetical protein